MARWIDADAMLEYLDLMYDKQNDWIDSYATGVLRAIYYIKHKAPSIDIVQCKECKHWHDHITTTWCSRGAELRPQESGWVKRDAEDFCSYGERRE